jgi:hypothetical protein
MNIPHEVELDKETASQLDSIASFQGNDNDPRLLQEIGFDEAMFRTFLAEIGQSESVIGKEILDMKKAADAAATQKLRWA